MSAPTFQVLQGDVREQLKKLPAKSVHVCVTSPPYAVKSRILAGMRPKRVVGSEQVCGCPPHEPIPCTVLDPFTGSGTTGVVAGKLGRSFVGSELSGTYHAMAVERLAAAYAGLTLREHRAGQGSLFEEVAAGG